jgi:hypothetical protein
MDGTPPPLVADVVEALGPHVRQDAADALPRGQGHGLPALVLGLLRAAAHVAGRDREPPAMGQGAAVDLSAQVIQPLLWALPGGCAGDHPPVGPSRLGQAAVGPFLTEQREH